MVVFLSQFNKSVIVQDAFNLYQAVLGSVHLKAAFCLKEVFMFGKAPGANKGDMKFVVAFRLNDQITKELMQRVIDSGFQPEQIARYALKKYLNELSRTEG